MESRFEAPDPQRLAGLMETESVAPAAPLSEGAGTTVDRYKLLQLIGEGGFGAVFMAEQAVPVRRRVALKIIKLGMDTRRVVARFEAERQALAMMDHPNIARVFDAGATETGRPYFVMELVRGSSITDYCDKHSLTTRQRLELFLQVCHAVQHAHQKGIIHRDIKPSNVLVTVTDGKPVPKVIDFGIAKATNASLTEKTLFTEFRQLIGTPQYMSPEQADSDGVDIDTRSDIYSLGVLLYELLTGTTPFDSNALRSAAYAEIQRVIREVDPPTPSLRLGTLGNQLTTVAARRKIEPKRLGQLVRGELDWIVMKAMDKERGRRYDTPDSLAADIDRHLRDEPVLAKPPSMRYLLGKRLRRHRLALISSLAVIGATLGMGLISYLRIAEKNRTIVEKAAEALAGKAHAEREARVAKLNLAWGRVAEGKAQINNMEFGLAREPFEQAHRLLNEIGEPTFLADMWLWNSCDISPPPLLELAGDGTPVNGVAFLPDGGRLVSGSESGTLRIHDARTGVVLREIKNVGPVRCLSVSPDGHTVACATLARTVALLDLQTGGIVSEVRGFAGDALSVAFSPDGKRLLVGTTATEANVQLFEVPSARTVRILPGHTAPVRAVAFTPDGLRAVTASGRLPGDFGEYFLDTFVRAWDLSDGHPIWATNADTNGRALRGLAVAPDGTCVACAAYDGGVKIFDLATGLKTNEGNSTQGDVGGVAFSADGTLLATAEANNSIQTWLPDLELADRRYSGGMGPTTASIAFSPNGAVLVSGGMDGVVRLWPVFNNPEHRTFRAHPSQVTQYVGRDAFPSYSPDGRLAASVTAHRLRVWDVATGYELQSTDGETNEHPVPFLPGGRTILVYEPRGGVRLWDIEAGRSLRTFGPYGVGGVGALAASPNGRWAAVSSHESDQTVVFDLAKGEVNCSIRCANGASAEDLLFSRDERILFLAGGGEIQVFDLKTREARHFDARNCDGRIALSPDGTTLACVRSVLRLIDVETGSEISPEVNCADWIHAVTFSPNGKFVLYGGERRLIECRAVRPVHDLQNQFGSGDTYEMWRTIGFVRGLCWSPRRDCLQLLCGQDAIEGSVTLRDLSRPEQDRWFTPRLAAACVRLTHDPLDAVSLKAFGEWYDLHGIWGWAIDLLEQARRGGAEISPVMLGRCYWRIGDVDQARAQFALAIARSEDAGEVAYLKVCVAAINGGVGAPERSAADLHISFARRLRLNGRSFDAQVRELDRAEKADSRRAEEVRHLRAQLQNDQAREWIESGKDLEKCESMIREALRVDPKRDNYLASMGWVLYKQNRLHESAQFFEESIAIRPDDPRTWIDTIDLLGDVRWRLGETNEASRMWGRGLTESIKIGTPGRITAATLRKKLDATANGDTPELAPNASEPKSIH